MTKSTLVGYIPLLAAEKPTEGMVYMWPVARDTDEKRTMGPVLGR